MLTKSLNEFGKLCQKKDRLAQRLQKELKRKIKEVIDRHNKEGAGFLVNSFAVSFPTHKGRVYNIFVELTDLADRHSRKPVSAESLSSSDKFERLLIEQVSEKLKLGQKYPVVVSVHYDYLCK
ncbi:MAG: hypothetical protein HYW90_05005 [Candidatus Sungbacteria bacterium]|nr:hypothetical protein [Candidatus Sungbacteria bacterium]